MLLRRDSCRMPVLEAGTEIRCSLVAKLSDGWLDVQAVDDVLAMEGAFTTASEGASLLFCGSSVEETRKVAVLVTGA